MINIFKKHLTAFKRKIIKTSNYLESKIEILDQYNYILNFF